jgi:tRNA pseudouridine13 synthase
MVYEPGFSTGDLAAVGGSIGPEPEHFVVDELPEFPLSGAGEHLYVRIEKRNLTTQQALEAVARAARVNPRDVGSAGMKDKHAVTTQWLSLPASGAPVESWQLPEGVRVLEHTLHDRKLRTGQLAGNRFRIRLTAVPEGGLARARAVLARLAEQGLHNYFGAQRFGIGGANLPRALRWLDAPDRRDPRARFHRKLYPSVLQSEAFNRFLALRAEHGLGRLLAGDVVRLDGSRSVFVVEDAEREQRRLAARDIHLTGPLPGPRTRKAAGLVAELEARALAEAGLGPDQLARLGRFVDGTRRDLVVDVSDATVSEPVPGELELVFSLPAGSYATQLVRELTRAPFFAARESERES